MAPMIVSEATNEVSKPFVSKSKKNKIAKEEITMTEVVEPTNVEVVVPVEKPVATSALSIADLYKELETELVLRGENKNEGVTARIRETVDSIFAATQKDKLLVSAVVKIVETQEGRKKLYNLVRSVANTKGGKYELVNIDGTSYIALRK